MKQAIILAAGEGQRLRPFTVNRPKAMLSIADKPMLQYVVEALAHTGIRNIVLVVGYRKDQVLDYMGTGEQFGVEITYVTQKEQLGTAHALAQAKASAEEQFLVLPGDKLIEADTVAHLIEAKPATVLVKRVANPARYGVVTVSRNRVKGILEKPKQAESNLVNTGIYVFSKDIFTYIEPELSIPDALNNMIADGHAVNALETTNTWLDVVYPWDILALNEAVLGRISPGLSGTIEANVSMKGTVSVGKGTVIRSNSYIAGPVVIGEGCEIGPNVCIMAATSIGDNVTISPFTEIKNSVIGGDVNIGPGSIIHDSVIDKGCTIKGHFTAFNSPTEIRVNEDYHVVNVGAMLGEACKLDNNVTAQAGVIVGNYCQVQAMKLISGRLPDKSIVY
ncbi:MAG: sugar phosphate nucleotidyltransferase [Dehalococcoidales bacterium]|nr:sugar phosphate nucleotidyltransferase [Dehalococcoidales bacterium]